MIPCAKLVPGHWSGMLLRTATATLEIRKIALPFVIRASTSHI